MLIPAAGCLLLGYIYFKGIRKYKKITITLGFAAIILSTVAASLEYMEYSDLVEKIETNQVETTEGKIENYKALDTTNHGAFESFTVNGIKFAYSDYHKVAGYHHACTYGGVICKNDQQVKLSYYEEAGLNYIVKIELEKE